MNIRGICKSACMLSELSNSRTQLCHTVFTKKKHFSHTKWLTDLSLSTPRTPRSMTVCETDERYIETSLPCLTRFVPLFIFTNILEGFKKTESTVTPSADKKVLPNPADEYLKETPVHVSHLSTRSQDACAVSEPLVRLYRRPMFTMRTITSRTTVCTRPRTR